MFHFFNVTVSHVSIYNWIIHFSPVFESLSNYLLSKANLTSDDWHADETFIKLNGKDIYLWVLLDSETRVVISHTLSDKRDSASCMKLFKASRQITDSKPLNIFTDALPAYIEAVNLYYKGIVHVICKDKIPKSRNNIIEAFNSIFKNWYRTKRGFKSFRSAGKLIKIFMFHYNFIKEHSGISYMTPAEVAGIKYKKTDKKNWFLF